MWVELNQRKNGVCASTWVRTNLPAASANSSSTVSIRLRVNGPVSLISWVPSAFNPGVDDAAGAEPLPEVREVLGRGVVVELGLLLGVEVVQVAEELVEAVGGRQVLVPVTEVVLAELAGGVTVRLERGGDRRVPGWSPTVAPGIPTLVRPVRIGFCPQMNAARPAVQLCSP